MFWFGYVVAIALGILVGLAREPWTAASIVISASLAALGWTIAAIVIEWRS